MIAFYYGLTGISCAWYYRATLSESARNLWLRGILPLLGGVMLWGALGYNLWFYWQPVNSYTGWQMTFWPHWHIGGVFLIDSSPSSRAGVDVRLRRHPARRSSGARYSTATPPPWCPRTSAPRSACSGSTPDRLRATAD